jgi:phosphodiesterase/alkaline phosphatase D-like protein
MSEMLVDTNENLQYSQTANRGYLSVKLTHEKVDTQFHYISTVEDKVFESAGTDRFEVTKRNSGKGVQLKKV